MTKHDTNAGDWSVWWCEYQQAPRPIQNCRGRLVAGTRTVRAVLDGHDECRPLRQDPLGRFRELSGEEHHPSQRQ